MQQTSTEGVKDLTGFARKNIHRGMCESLKFDHITEQYLIKLESVQENETYEILWNFEIQMDHLISTR